MAVMEGNTKRGCRHSHLPAASSEHRRAHLKDSLQLSQVVIRCSPARLSPPLRDAGMPLGTAGDPQIHEKEVILDVLLISQHPCRPGGFRGSPRVWYWEGGGDIPVSETRHFRSTDGLSL